MLGRLGWSAHVAICQPGLHELVGTLPPILLPFRAQKSCSEPAVQLDVKIACERAAECFGYR